MRTRKKHWRKRPQDIEAYFERAIADGKTQAEMALERGVERATIRSWMKDIGYECVTTWVKRTEAA